MKKLLIVLLLLLLLLPGNSVADTYYEIPGLIEDTDITAQVQYALIHSGIFEVVVISGGKYQISGITVPEGKTLRGAGCGNRNNYTNQTVNGTVLEITGAGIATSGRRVHLSDFAVWGDSSASLVHMNNGQNLSSIKRLFIGNAGSGTALKVSDTWMSIFEDIDLVGNGSGTGFELVTDIQSGGNRLENITASNFSTGIHSYGSKIMSSTLMNRVQGRYCGTGIKLENVRGQINEAWTEYNDLGLDLQSTMAVNGGTFVDGIKISADRCQVKGAYFPYVFVNKSGVFVQSGKGVEIDRCYFHPNGGPAILLEDKEYESLSITYNDYSEFPGPAYRIGMYVDGTLKRADQLVEVLE